MVLRLLFHAAGTLRELSANSPGTPKAKSHSLRKGFKVFGKVPEHASWWKSDHETTGITRQSLEKHRESHPRNAFQWEGYPESCYSWTKWGQLFHDSEQIFHAVGVTFASKLMKLGGLFMIWM